MSAPLKISPLIRTARWCLLSAGVFYGYKHKADIREIREEERVNERIIKAKFLADIKKKQELANAEFERTSILFGHNTKLECKSSKPDDPPPTGKMLSLDEEEIFGSFNLKQKPCPCGLESCGQKDDSSSSMVTSVEPGPPRNHREDKQGFCIPTSSNDVYENEVFDDGDDNEEEDGDDNEEDDDDLFHGVWMGEHSLEQENEDDDDAMKYGTFREFIKSKIDEHNLKKQAHMKPSESSQSACSVDDSVLDSFEIVVKPCGCGNPNCGKTGPEPAKSGVGAGRSCEKIHFQTPEGFCAPIEEQDCYEDEDEEEEEQVKVEDMTLCGVNLGDERFEVNEEYDMEKKTCGSKSSSCYRCNTPYKNDKGGNPDCHVCTSYP